VSVEPAARERILESAYDLFSRKGVRAVGVEEVIERSAVAKATLYRHFPSKDDLVLAFLRRREEVWTHGWVEAEARRRGASPRIDCSRSSISSTSGSTATTSRVARSSTSCSRPRT
jgi:AcrR family transcriptional regulator